MPEIERLKTLNTTLFRRGLPQVKSIQEWEQRVKKRSILGLPTPPPG
jgi:hypothetical protein